MVLGLIAEINDDLWNLYNLLNIEDEVEAFTSRKVYKDSANRSKGTEIKKFMMTICITNISFESEGTNLRISGKNVKTNDYVKIGQYHTFNIGLHEKIKIVKKKWDVIHNQKLKECIDIKETSEVAILLLDCGTANMYLLTENLYKNIFSINKSIQKKREKNNMSAYKKSIESFFQLVFQNLWGNLNFEKIKCIVLGGPGFFKNDFYDYIYKNSEKKNDKHMLNLKNKFIIIKTSSVYKDSLNEILNDETMKKKILNMKVVSHVSVLNQFYIYFDKNEEKICYGSPEVEYAASINSIESLLITDKVFRNSDVVSRKKYVKLVQQVKNSGGKVFIFSDNHTSGEQLNALTGIAAILKFPVFFDNNVLSNSNNKENQIHNDHHHEKEEEDEEEENDDIKSVDLNINDWEENNDKREDILGNCNNKN